MKIKVPGDRQQNKIAFEFIKDIKENKKLLDIGAADCILKEFLPKNIKYYSLDIHDKEAKQDFILDLDKQKIPVKNNFFDIILCLDTLEHTMYPKKILKELKRIAKNDALFIFSLPNEYNFLQRAYYLFAIKKQTEKPWMVVEEHQHIHKPRIKDIIELFSESFKIKAVRYHWESRASGRKRIFWYVDRFINLLSKVYPGMFARDVVVVCRSRSNEE